MKFIFSLLILISTAAQAHLELAPPSFSIEGGKAIFVDFITADYKIAFDTQARSSLVTSTIQFKTREAGMPLFDLVPNPVSVTLNGSAVEQALIPTPSDRAGTATRLRLVKKPINPGDHILVITHKLENEVSPVYSGGSVSVAFFMTDLSDRGYLERYLPANLEFDQVKMRLSIEIEGLSTEQVFFTNGWGARKRLNAWTFEYPSYFTASSIYFHTGPAENFRSITFNYRSSDGRNIPTIIYQKPGADMLEKFKTQTIQNLNEFEADYGPFPHPTLTIYATSISGGGMEYSGATASGLWALKHELAHSYFARGVMPANGNGGWIDEAMASWAGGPYTPGPLPGTSAGMGNHGPYNRVTDDAAYNTGMALLEHIGGLMNKSDPSKSMKGFLRAWREKNLFRLTTSQNLQRDMEAYHGASLTPLFNKYVYGQSERLHTGPSRGLAERVHMRLSPQLVRRLY